MKRNRILFAAIVTTLVLGLSPLYSENISERFNPEKKLSYEVFFNGLPTGKIEWRYLGRVSIDGHPAEVLYLNSDTEILKLLSLESKEKVFLDASNHLPLKVERDVTFFGKHETISELYNQDNGVVKIVKKTNRTGKEILLYSQKPVHNILSLLYFFPKDTILIKDKDLYFNLPTQKVKIRMVSEGTLSVERSQRHIYFLTGKGANKFNLWLDKKERTPLRIEFFVPLGKIVIVRKA
jgi:hypothetical protein